MQSYQQGITFSGGLLGLVILRCFPNPSIIIIDFFYFKILFFIILSDTDYLIYHCLRQHFPTQMAQIVFEEAGRI